MPFFKRNPSPQFNDVPEPEWDPLAYGHDLARRALSIFDEAAQTLQQAIEHHGQVVEEAEEVIAEETARKQEAQDAIQRHQQVLGNIEAITAPAKPAEPATAV